MAKSPYIPWKVVQKQFLFAILGKESVSYMHFYDYHKILSYNCPVNILIGERGVGKSFGAKKYVIDQYAKKHSQFLYLRRYDNELKEIFQNTKNSSKDFFDDIKSKYKGIELCAKNRKFYYNNEVFRIC